MAVKRYTADTDTTITNAYKENLSTRATSANMGASDSLEVFSIWGQRSGSAEGPSVEKSRALVKFPISSIVTDRTNGNIPAVGSVNFYLKMSNAEHPGTLPSDYTMNVLAVSESWSEGYGLDMETYKDLGEASWDNATTSAAWGSAGGTFHTGSSNSTVVYSAAFTGGDENLEVDITTLVEQWIVGTKSNYGIGLSMSGAFEDGTLSGSFYTKKFFARGSEYFYKRPQIEARWDSSKKDDRANFYAATNSNHLLLVDQANTLYLYNSVRGQLKTFEGFHASNTLDVKLYSAIGDAETPVVSAIAYPTADAGIYTASVSYASAAPVSYLYDVWTTGSVSLHTGSAITVKTFSATAENPNPTYVTSMVSLNSKYSRKETARFRLFARKQNWSPTIYTKATQALDSEVVDSTFYKVFRVSDNFEVIPYGTGSTNHTKLSYDQSGSYFDLDMSLLETDYSYGLNFVYYLNGKYMEQPEVFKFRVEK
jgi:hypothetical protein